MLCRPSAIFCAERGKARRALSRRRTLVLVKRARWEVRTKKRQVHEQCGVCDVARMGAKRRSLGAVVFIMRLGGVYLGNALLAVGVHKARVLGEEAYAHGHFV